jgi:hypothetical protein
VRWRSGESIGRRFKRGAHVAKHYGGSIEGDALDSPAAARSDPRPWIVVRWLRWTRPLEPQEYMQPKLAVQVAVA